MGLDQLFFHEGKPTFWFLLCTIHKKLIMCVCVCVCVYIYIYIYIYGYNYVSINIYQSYICVHLYTHTYVFSHSVLSLCDPLGCSPPGSSIHGIFQARTLEWVAISFSRGSSQPRNWTCVSCTTQATQSLEVDTRDQKCCLNNVTEDLGSHLYAPSCSACEFHPQGCKMPMITLGIASTHKEGRRPKAQSHRTYWVWVCGNVDTVYFSHHFP